MHFYNHVFPTYHSLFLNHGFLCQFWGKKKKKSRRRRKWSRNIKRNRMEWKKEIKGRVVLMKKSLLYFPDIKSSIADRVYELLGKRVSIQLISASIPDPGQLLFLFLSFFTGFENEWRRSKGFTADEKNKKEPNYLFFTSLFFLLEFI